MVLHGKVSIVRWNLKEVGADSLNYGIYRKSYWMWDVCSCYLYNSDGKSAKTSREREILGDYQCNGSDNPSREAKIASLCDFARQ